MKPLEKQIQETLTPNGSVGLTYQDKIYRLIPMLPIHQFFELVKDLEKTGRQEMVDYLYKPSAVLFNGMIYFATQGLNIKGRLKEMLTIYHNHLKETVGDKKALINLYETIPAEDIANLTEDHVIFVLKKTLRGDSKELAAIRYLPPYEIHFEKKTYYMPGCTLAIHIDRNLTIGNPEVIAEEGGLYEHPFVYRGRKIFGQNLCMGSFYDSKEKKQFRKLRFANNINALIKQAVQILISGYNSGVNPANGHLNDQKYKKYTKMPNNWDNQSKWGTYQVFGDD